MAKILWSFLLLIISTVVSVWLKKKNYKNIVNIFVLPTRHLIIENFIPLEEKNKIVTRATFDEEDDLWKMTPITRIQKYIN